MPSRRDMMEGSLECGLRHACPHLRERDCGEVLAENDRLKAENAGLRDVFETATDAFEEKAVRTDRVAQEYNLRKGRRDAFWEDRYHATAIDGGLHLRHCMAYIDLNMVRAGAVDHPGEWVGSGYREIQRPLQRYRIIDTERTAELLGLLDADDLAAEQNRWVQEALSEEESILLQRQDVWTESLAVGSDTFADKVARMLGVRSKFRNLGSAPVIVKTQMWSPRPKRVEWAFYN